MPRDSLERDSKSYFPYQTSSNFKRKTTGFGISPNANLMNLTATTGYFSTEYTKNNNSPKIAIEN